MNRHLQQVILAVEVHYLFSFFHVRADTGRGQHAAKAVAAGADAFGKGSLRNELHFQFAGEHLIAGYGVQSDMAGKDFLYLVIGNQSADAHIRLTCCNRDRRNIFNALFYHAGDNLFRRNFSVKIAEHYGHSIMDLIKYLVQCRYFLFQSKCPLLSIVR